MKYLLLKVLGLSLVTGPVEEPVDLADAKEYIRVNYSDEDNLISAMILPFFTHAS